MAKFPKLIVEKSEHMEHPVVSPYLPDFAGENVLGGSEQA
jgi:hypothetical protein